MTFKVQIVPNGATPGCDKQERQILFDVAIHLTFHSVGDLETHKSKSET